MLLCLIHAATARIGAGAGSRQQAAVAAGAVAVRQCLSLIGATPKLAFSDWSNLQLPASTKSSYSSKSQREVTVRC